MAMAATMNAMDKVIYTAKVHTTGGRDGAARSSDGRLDVKLATPGTGRPGTNPEQLFAAGWSACFMSAIAHRAAERKIALPSDRTIDAEVDLGTNEEGYMLRARLNVHLPGIPARCRPVAGGRRARKDLPVLQNYPRQHRRDDQPRFNGRICETVGNALRGVLRKADRHGGRSLQLPGVSACLFSAIRRGKLILLNQLALAMRVNPRKLRWRINYVNRDRN